MNRFDFYFEQLVTQADMDEAFDFAEDADQLLMAINGFTGVVAGQVLTENSPTPDLTVDISGGTAFDQDGQNVTITALQNLDLSVDSNSVSTAVASGGNEKWVSVFVAFDRVLSDPRVDGNGTPLQYRRTESFQFIVDQGAEAAAGSPAVYTSGNTETFTLSNGQTLEVVVDGTPAQTVTFNTGDFANIALATAAEVAAVIQTDVVGVTAADATGAVAITSRMTGPSASVRVVGGTAASQFAWPAAAAVGSGGPARPALRPDSILLADVLLRFGTTQIFDAPGNNGATDGVIDAFTRRETVFVFNGAQFTIKAGTITGFATALGQELNNHITQTGAAHTGAAVSYDPTVLPIPAVWSDTAAAGELQSAIDGVVNDLEQDTGTDGAALVGAAAAGNLAQGTVRTQLNELDTEKGGLATANTWTADNNFDGGLSFQDPGSTVSGFRKEHRFEVFDDTDWNDTETIDIEVYNNTAARVGIIRGSIMVTSDSEDGWVAREFWIPFGKDAAAVPNIGSGPNHWVEHGDVGTNSTQIVAANASTQTGTITWSVVTGTNTIAIRLTQTDGVSDPFNVRIIAEWEVVDGAQLV